MTLPRVWLWRGERKDSNVAAWVDLGDNRMLCLAMDGTFQVSDSWERCDKRMEALDSMPKDWERVS